MQRRRGGPGAVPATAVCCFRYWEKGSSGEGEFFAIYIFISDIDAQLAFVSFTKGQRRRGGPAAIRTTGHLFTSVQMCKYPVSNIQYQFQCQFKCRHQLLLKLVIGDLHTSTLAHLHTACHLRVPASPFPPRQAPQALRHAYLHAEESACRVRRSPVAVLMSN